MIVVMTLLVRDEADIVDEQISFHLAAGVDFVIATDHRSGDGTTEILERYASSGKLQLIREDAEKIRQGEWVTRMARIAATEYGADWVIHSDADEFWWPRGGELKDVLARVPERYGVLNGLLQNFVPRPGDGWFAERMTLRFAPKAPINDPTSPFRPASQVVHRGHRDIEVVQGNHGIRGVSLAGLRGWHPFEILHFPFRSASQCARKHRNTLEGWERNPRGDLARARSLLEQGRGDAFWERVVVDDALQARGLAEGAFVQDTRVRDALLGTPRDPLGSRQRTIPSTPSSPTESVSLGIQGAALADANAVRVRQWLDGVDARVRALERRGA
jgi:hypothetical protein